MKSYTKRQLHKARGIKTWYLRTYEDGRTTYTSLKTSNSKIAQEIVDRMNASRFFPEMAPRQSFNSGRTEIVKAANKYLDNVSKITPKSYVVYKNASDTFLAFCAKESVDYVEDIGKSVAIRYVEYLSGMGMKSNTIRLKVVVATSIVKNACERAGVDFINPFNGVKLPKIVRTVKDFWVTDEVNTIIANAPAPSYRMLWSFMGYAGLRIHEAMNVKESDIVDGTLRVMGKGDKYAVLPISSVLESEIELYRKSGGTFGEDMKIGEQRSNIELLKTVKRAGVNKGSWCSNHKLRHSFASNLARNGCPEKIAQTLMRHASISMTMEVYTHVLPEDVKKWAEKL